MNKIKLYFVTYRAWGADRSKREYFRTKNEAKDFKRKTEYTNDIGYTQVTPEEAKILLREEV